MTRRGWSLHTSRVIHIPEVWVWGGGQYKVSLCGYAVLVADPNAPYGFINGGPAYTGRRCKHCQRTLQYKLDWLAALLEEGNEE